MGDGHAGVDCSGGGLYCAGRSGLSQWRAGAIGALSKAIGAETQRPIAVVIVGGTISTALLTRIVLPVMYRLVMNLKLRLRRSEELAERAEAAEALAEALATESDHR